MISRRCGTCGAENDADAVYCKSCKSFLLSDSAGRRHYRKPPSIWAAAAGMTTVQDARPSPAGGRPAGGQKLRWAAICPRCGARIALRDEQLPLLCIQCSYYFQITDKAVPISQTGRTDEGGEKTPAPPAAGQQTGQTRQNGQASRSPWSTAPAPDRSELRLISCSDRRTFVLTANPKGSIFGTSGNMTPQILRGVFRNVAPQHFMVYHTDAGWYMRPLGGLTLYNGDHTNTGVEITLEDGDLINAGDCPLRVEITAVVT